jgi:DNA-binding NtrC family response regulator
LEEYERESISFHSTANFLNGCNLWHGLWRRQVAVEKTILVAEDNSDLLEVTGIFLALMGYTPVTCCDGEVASAMYEMHRSFALLITDLEMPGKSGLELARELTALQHGLPVIIVSGAMITDEMWLEMRARNWLFLAKPYVLPVLLASVQSLIRESAVTRKEPKLK